jgi:hypothetical protein
MLFFRRPSFLGEAQAVRWMREQAAPLAGLAAVDRVDVTRLQAPALRGGTDWQWLIEMHCRRGEQAELAARDDACRDLIADLRLLGLHPTLVVADDTEWIEE